MLISAPLVGMRYRPAGTIIISGLGMDQELRLEREPGNPFDENAIKVLLPSDWNETLPELWAEALAEAESISATLSPDSTHIGYVAREFAKDWAPLMDQAGESFPPARLTFSSGGSPMVSFEVEGEEESD